MSKSLNGIVKAWEAKLKKSQAAAKRRSNSIFTVMSVAHVDDDDDDDEQQSHIHQKAFFNGDIYTGQWSGVSPHGTGKYLWTDGCMYVGEWISGKPMGKGRFSWPSGATYEGRFKNSFMDGEGIYTGSSDETYRGGWVCNTRHGKGAQSYANGDHYEGQFRRGLPEGKGRYQWKNGNHYVGHWKKGQMSGQGTMVWRDGNRYDGNWESGLPRGNGTFRWVDGSFYAGVWSEDQRERSGTYYPSNSSESPVSWDPQEVYMVQLSCCRIGSCEEIPVFPSEKSFDWLCSKNPAVKNSSSARVRRLSLDGGAPPESESEGSSGGGGELPRGSIRPNLLIKPTQKQGLTISKGHKNYELMLNLQLGIRHSVGRPAPATSLDLKSSDFDPKEKIWTRFPPEGSKHTPPHQSTDFRWKDYCPVVFRTLRKLFKVDPADYMISICGNDALRELCSPGKSGSFFYLTNDDKYMIKTMKKSETKVLIRMLSAYYNHVRAFENTLVTKFFGLHCVKLAGPAQKKVRFVIMGNLFCTAEYVIHRRFDLKGSSLGRLTDKPESEIQATTTLKDLDLNFIFRLHKFWFQKFSSQVDRDSEFLEQERIMDYSLLIGIHFRDVSPTGEPLSASHSGNCRRQMDQATESNRRLGSNVPARAELTVRSNAGELVGEPTGEHYDVVLVFGIIDILQDYDISKKLEHAYKSFQYDPTSISAVDPRQYSKRFRDFIRKVFAEDT
ncbi:hypothetical protein M569_14398 [Genlisea aurea]|uniref:Phosphatidylinositol 4-phosphate 5-kinase n=1 Tax=Genlisea aurea TaxID=192259 RepID=S8C0U4_9LAMI|nr:hypothetical protein M569_14398 [Genlisea aurea]